MFKVPPCDSVRWNLKHYFENHKNMPKIILDRNICIGCGSCQALCPKYWEMADDGKVNLLNSQKTENEKYELELDDVGCNQQAEEACPVQCIHIDKS